MNNSPKEFNTIVSETKEALESAGWGYSYCGYKGSDDEKICSFMERQTFSSKKVADLISSDSDLMEILEDKECLDNELNGRSVGQYCACWIASCLTTRTKKYGWELGESTCIELAW